MFVFVDKMSASKTLLLTGGCQCGAIRYRVQGKPAEPIGVCHCRMCQKAMGNVFGIFAPFQTEDVTWTKGTPAKFRSSSASFRLFCSNCGTPLAFQLVTGKITELTVGSFDHPAEVAPVMQTGIESRIEWTNSMLELPARNTLEIDPTSSTFISYQHPDHD